MERIIILFVFRNLLPSNRLISTLLQIFVMIRIRNLISNFPSCSLVANLEKFTYKQLRKIYASIIINDQTQHYHLVSRNKHIWKNNGENVLMMFSSTAGTTFLYYSDFHIYIASS